jgi:PAP2 superfamily
MLEGVTFLAQCLIAISVELGDDLGRGIFSQHGTLEGVRNAQNIAAFEAAHGLWVEPAWQTFFEKTRHFLILTVTWPDMAHLWNGIYIMCHIFVTLGVAFWIYFYRRRSFAFARNTIILTNILALLVYERYPVAPPRLTPGLTFGRHAFSFQDTVFGIASAGGRFVAPPVGYNEFSALPSVHLAWAMVAGAAVVLLAKPLIVKILGLIYPFVMLVAVVVTGNHYLMDAVAAVPVVIAAALIALAIERVKGQVRLPFNRRMPAPGT